MSVTPDLPMAMAVEGWVGMRFRQTCEYVIFGTKGSGIPITRYDVGTWHSWPREGHSVKPRGFFELVESVSPGPYAELFARNRRDGWEGWGNEYV